MAVARLMAVPRFSAAAPRPGRAAPGLSPQFLPPARFLAPYRSAMGPRAPTPRPHRERLGRAPGRRAQVAAAIQGRAKESHVARSAWRSGQLAQVRARRRAAGPQVQDRPVPQLPVQVGQVAHVPARVSAAAQACSAAARSPASARPPVTTSSGPLQCPRELLRDRQRLAREPERAVPVAVVPDGQVEAGQGLASRPPMPICGPGPAPDGRLRPPRRPGPPGQRRDRPPRHSDSSQGPAISGWEGSSRASRAVVKWSSAAGGSSLMATWPRNMRAPHHSSLPPRRARRPRPAAVPGWPAGPGSATTAPGRAPAAPPSPDRAPGPRPARAEVASSASSCRRPAGSRVRVYSPATASSAIPAAYPARAACRHRPPGLGQQPGPVGPQRLQHPVPGPAIRPGLRRDQQRAFHQPQHGPPGPGPPPPRPRPG